MTTHYYTKQTNLHIRQPRKLLQQRLREKWLQTTTKKSFHVTVAIISHRQRPVSLPPPSSSGWAILLSVSCWCSTDLQPGKSLWVPASSAASQSHPEYTFLEKSCYMLALKSACTMRFFFSWMFKKKEKHQKLGSNWVSHLSGGVAVSVVWLVCRRRKGTGNGPFVQI